MIPFRDLQSARNTLRRPKEDGKCKTNLANQKVDGQQLGNSHRSQFRRVETNLQILYLFAYIAQSHGTSDTVKLVSRRESHVAMLSSTMESSSSASSF